MNKIKSFPFFLVLLFSCSNSKDGQIQLTLANHALEVKVAATNAERQAALYLHQLSPHDGVLICYPRERYQAFYSKKEGAQLSLAFIKADGVIDDIQSLLWEYDSDDQERVAIPNVSKTEGQYTLVTSEGWFNQHGVKPGYKVDLPLPIKNAPSEELYALTINGVKAYVELATTEGERAKGLMHRRGLSKDDGMLFIYRTSRTHSFWMKNTRIPLSIAYIKSDGIISSLHDMEPMNRDSIRSMEPVQYALEMNQGWFKNHQIKPGDKVLIPAEVQAVHVED